MKEKKKWANCNEKKEIKRGGGEEAGNKLSLVCEKERLKYRYTEMDNILLPIYYNVEDTKEATEMFYYFKKKERYLFRPSFSSLATF